jgi:broad specificity phosphatase PhoE
MNEIWLVRHGETEWTVSKKHTGRTDVPLTPAGEEQARGLKDVLAGHEFELVLTSPRERARKTAELAGFPDAEVDDRLVEVDYGDYEGRTTAEIRAERPGWFLWRDGSPGGESIDAAGERADGVVGRIAKLEGDVLLFGHGHFTRVLATRLLGVPAIFGQMLILGPGSLSVVGSEHDVRAIRSWNWEDTRTPGGALTP